MNLQLMNELGKSDSRSIMEGIIAGAVAVFIAGATVLFVVNHMDQTQPVGPTGECPVDQSEAFAGPMIVQRIGAEAALQERERTAVRSDPAAILPSAPSSRQSVEAPTVGTPDSGPAPEVSTPIVVVTSDPEVARMMRGVLATLPAYPFTKEQIDELSGMKADDLTIEGVIGYLGADRVWKSTEGNDAARKMLLSQWVDLSDAIDALAITPAEAQLEAERLGVR